MAVIKVGAATETEMKYKKVKIENALNATRAAMEEGIIPGGGVALLKAVYLIEVLIKEKNLSDEEMIGVKIVEKALEYPLRQIAENAGIQDISIIIEDVKKKDNIGYDFSNLTSKNLKDGKVDMLEAGIIDPLKVTRSALENAASMASVFLTTEAAITDIPEEKNQGGGQGMPGGGMPGGGMPMGM